MCFAWCDMTDKLVPARARCIALLVIRLDSQLVN